MKVERRKRLASRTSSSVLSTARVRRPGRPMSSTARAFERKHAGCWPVGHLAGWRGPSGFSSRSTAREVVRENAGLHTLHGRVAVVTGANCGVGFETARAIALGGAEVVVLACRDSIAGAEAARVIQDEARFVAGDDGSSSCRVCCLRVDMESFESVRTFADAFARLNLPLHILVHNAGLMPAPYERTRDGHERHMQVNVLSPVLLTRLLFRALRGEDDGSNTAGADEGALLEKNAAARVVFVTSAAHRFTYPEGVRLSRQTDTHHQASRANHDPMRAYGESKLCVLFLAKIFACACEASRAPRQRRVAFFAAHPGAIVTKGSERARLESGGWRGAALHAIGRPFLKTAEAGAASVAFCCVARFEAEEDASSEEKDGKNSFFLKNGAYVVNCDAARASRFVERDVRLARRACRFAITATNAFPETRNDAFAEQLANGAYGA